MALLSFIGWAFLALGFFGAAAELTVHAVLPGHGLYISGHDVWFLLAPDGLTRAHIWIDGHIGAGFWESVVRPALAPPLWITLGVPGFVMIWKARVRNDDDDEAQRREDAMTLYDELAHAARADGYIEGDDMAPTYGDVAVRGNIYEDGNAPDNETVNRPPF